MKRIPIPMVVVAMLWCHAVHAQCSGNLKTITYDTTVTTDVNDIYYDYLFTFPKFDPSLGTLTDMRIASVVTLKYRFELENNEDINISYRVRVDRTDEVNSTDGSIDPYDNRFRKTYGAYPLAASDGVTGSGPDYVEEGPDLVVNRDSITYTPVNLANFQGAGNTEFEYYVETLGYALVGLSTRYTLTGQGNDTLTFSVSYTYCPAIALASDILMFKATKRSDKDVNLQWVTQNEQPGRKYTVEKSNDGKNFSAVKTFNAIAAYNDGAAYQYSYMPTSRENGNLSFRLRLEDADGAVSYSPIRVIALDKPVTSLKIYPNPSTDVATLLFSKTERNNWQVDLVNMNGMLVKRYQFNNALLGKIDLRENSIPTGIYMIRALNKDTKEQLTERMVVQ